MLLRIGHAPRRAGMSTDQVMRHWRGTHGDAALQLPGLRRYLQLPPVLVDGQWPLGHPGFDVISMTVFDDLEAMDAAFASDHYRRTVVADEQVLIDKSRFGLFLGRGPQPHDPAPDACWLVTFHVRHPSVSSDAFGAALDGLDPGPAATGRWVLHGEDRSGEGRLARTHDAVDIAEFPDADAAIAWHGSAPATAADMALGGLSIGTIRHLAHPEVLR